MKIAVSKNNDHDGVSHGVKCREEGDRIAALESNGQSLEHEHHISCVKYNRVCYVFSRIIRFN